MDFLSTRPMEISTLALDGLSARHKVLAANIANADTPGYQRVDVSFEGQLAKMLRTDDQKQSMKYASMGISYNPNSLDFNMNEDLKLNTTSDDIKLNDTPNQVQDDENAFSEFQPETAATNNAPIKPDGNNVSIEYEMAELAKNGTKYSAITQLQGNIFKQLSDVIRGGGNA